MPPLSRQLFTASRAEQIAYDISHRSFTTVRRLESQAIFGIDLAETERESRQTNTPLTKQDVDDALSFLKGRPATRTSSFNSFDAGPQMTSRPDSQGEQQIGYDAAAWEAGYHAAALHGVTAIGEEDEFRAQAGKDEDRARLRGDRLRNLIRFGTPVAIVDPLDGSNQAAGMGQRSGWAACAMVRLLGEPVMSVSVLCGDGRGFVAGPSGVWLNEASHPDRPTIAYKLEPRLTESGFGRPHYVIPAGKKSTLVRARATLDADDKIEWIAPLGGNPGILSAMLAAGAYAAVQPEAYAWDHMAALVLAYAGFAVISHNDDEPMSPEELSEMLLTDMVEGRKTQSLYMGRTLEFARQLRSAGICADW